MVFEAFKRPLLIVHALVAMSLLGASTHQGLIAIGYLRGRFARAALEKVYLRLLVFLYPATFLLGSALYPTYRVQVRRDVLDLSAPFVSNLFDIKENLATLGAFSLLYLFLSRKKFTPTIDGWHTKLYAYHVITLTLFIWGMCVLGLYVTAEEGM